MFLAHLLPVITLLQDDLRIEFPLYLQLAQETTNTFQEIKDMTSEDL